MLCEGGPSAAGSAATAAAAVAAAAASAEGVWVCLEVVSVPVCRVGVQAECEAEWKLGALETHALGRDHAWQGGGNNLCETQVQ